MAMSCPARVPSGVTGVVLAVPKKRFDELIDLFRRSFGWPPPRLKTNRRFGATLAQFENTPVTLAAPVDDDPWVAERVKRFNCSPAAILIHSRDFDRSQRRPGIRETIEASERPGDEALMVRLADYENRL